MKKSIPFIVIMLIMGLGMSTDLLAVDYYVDPLGTDDGSHGTNPGVGAWQTIQYAVDNVPNPTTATIVINISGNTYTLNSDDIDIDRDFTDLTLSGLGAGTTIVQAETTQGSATERVFSVTAVETVVIKDMTIRYGRVTGGDPARGGGIFNAGNLTLFNAEVRECEAEADDDKNAYGGGVYSTGPLTVIGATISDNFAWGGNSVATIDGGRAYGGGIYSATSLAVMNATISGNNAWGGESGLNFNGGHGYGGGIYSAVSLTMTETTISGNTAWGGDSVASVFGGHGYGGGIYSDGGATVTAVFITGNNAIGGEDGVDAGTAGSAYGGGIYNVNGPSQSLTLTGVRIQNNTANGGDTMIDDAYGGHAYGGGIYNDGTTVVNESTISGNKAEGQITGLNLYQGGDAYGGGIFNNDSDSLTITKSTISGNTVQGGYSYWGAGSWAQGGGVCQYASGSGTLSFTNSTISGNFALRGLGSLWGYGNGGGLWGGDGVTLTSCTVASNVADDFGGGVYSDAGAGAGPNIGNSLFGNNDAFDDPHGPDLYGNFESGDYNLIENTSGCTLTGITTNNVTGLDPQLGNLGDNGGLTQTMPLCKTGDTAGGCAGKTNSPAIDQVSDGTNGCGTAPLNKDQRDEDRPYDAGLGTGACSGVACCDMGAYERTGPLLVELVYFRATTKGQRIVLSWETASEIDNAGFHIWRSETANGTYSQITDALILSEGGASQGTLYEYEDADVEAGRTFHYKLEDINYDGLSTFHGPVSSWVGVVDIKANGSDGPIVVSPDAPLSVSVDLNPGEYEGQSSDLWIAVNTPFAPPFDWYAYREKTGWQPGIHPWTQTPLSDLSSPTEVLNMSLPLGYYTFYFGVDDPDGRATGPWLGLDSVEVEVR